VARHERSFARYEQVLDLEHYLDVLERKPGALAGSSPLKQWRERGRWPESFDHLWQSLRERHGPPAGTRAMIELLTLGKRHGWDRLKQAWKSPSCSAARMRPRCGFWSRPTNSVVHAPSRSSGVN
jgi:hypothetical protein